MSPGPNPRPIKERMEELYQPEPMTGCWLWVGVKNENGYGLLHSKGKNLKAHRLSYMINVGSIPAGLFVLHHCDTPACINPHHLKTGTHSENMKDAIRRTNWRPEPPHARGELHPLAKFTANEIQCIRSDMRVNLKIAKEYNVSETTIWRIKHNQSYVQTEEDV